MIAIPRLPPPPPPPRTVRLAVITGCHGCLHVKTERTPGAGFALDYYCAAVTPARRFVGYVEWDSDKRKDHDFPVWCPLEVRTVEGSP